MSKPLKVCIDGMTCGSCSLLLERTLKGMPGVRKVRVDHRTGTALLICHPDVVPSQEDLAVLIEKAGYRMREDTAARAVESPQWLEIGAAFLIVLVIGKLLSIFDLVSFAPSTADALTVGGIFLIGLVAGTSSCLAVTGGLLLAVAAKHAEVHTDETQAQKWRPLLAFNAGRLLSYFVLGGLVGLIGTSLALSPRVTGVVNIAVALVMLFLGLSILRILPKGMLSVRPPRWISHRIMDLSGSTHPMAPFLLGALTFFLPCGFTQSLQLVALASGSFSTGALVMFVFALGTLPALLGISALSTSMRGNMSRWFLQCSGAAVFLLALLNLQSGMALAGFGDVPSQGGMPAGDSPVVGEDRVQEIAMRVTPTGYQPNALTIRAGVPVRWRVDGTQAAGCTSVLTIPSLNVTKVLVRGENIIEFTAPTKGSLAFMCSMGMVRGTMQVI